MKQKAIGMLALILCMAIALSGCGAINALQSEEAKEMIRENVGEAVEKVKEETKAAGEQVGSALNDVAKDILPDNMDGYTVGGASVDPAGVGEIEIDWISGAVVIEWTDGAQIEFSETAASTLSPEQQMRYKVEKGELHISFCAQNVISTPGKTLTLKLPSAMALTDVEVDAVSASVSIGALTADKLDVTTISGGIDIAGATFRKVDVETVSGEARIVSAGVPQEIELQSVSGGITLELPKALTGYTLKFETVSGMLDSNYAVTTNGKKQVYGDGSTQIEFESVSGGLAIR